jgi:hypothetical protein
VLDVVQNKNNPGEYFVYLDAPGPKRMAVSLIPGKKENLPAKGKTIEASLWDELRENPESNARSTLAYLVSVK